MAVKNFRFLRAARREAYGDVDGMMPEQGIQPQDGMLMRDLLGLRVLVVEPDRALACVLEDALGLAGARVIDVCSSMAEAQDALGAEAPEAVIVGTRPRQDLRSAAQAARKWGFPFLVICDDPGHAGDAATVHCLSKPFCYYDLVEGVIGCVSVDGAP